VSTRDLFTYDLPTLNPVVYMQYMYLCMHVSCKLVIFFFLIFSIVNVMRELQKSLPSNNTAQPIISGFLKVTEYFLNSNEGKFTVVFVRIHWMIITVGIILFFI